MRLWHKDLIPYLPRQQLLGQWRELCAIAKSIAETGTPNHILVNRIMSFPLAHLRVYGQLVCAEMRNRGYSVNYDKFGKWFSNDKDKPYTLCSNLFYGWHNERYLRQCFFNLQEKHDCGGITDQEWRLIEDKFLDKAYI